MSCKWNRPFLETGSTLGSPTRTIPLSSLAQCTRCPANSPLFAAHRKVKVHIALDTGPLRSESPPQKRSGMVGYVFSRDFTVLPVHPHVVIRNRNEPYLPLPSQPQLVLIYRPRRDGKLSRPWCGRDSNRQPPGCKSDTIPTTKPVAHLTYHFGPSGEYHAVLQRNNVAPAYRGRRSAAVWRRYCIRWLPQPPSSAADTTGWSERATTPA